MISKDLASLPRLLLSSEYFGNYIILLIITVLVIYLINRLLDLIFRRRN